VAQNRKGTHPGRVLKEITERPAPPRPADPLDGAARLWRAISAPAIRGHDTADQLRLPGSTRAPRVYDHTHFSAPVRRLPGHINMTVCWFNYFREYMRGHSWRASGDARSSSGSPRLQIQR
jgi:hypothetical protein